MDEAKTAKSSTFCTFWPVIERSIYIFYVSVSQSVSLFVLCITASHAARVQTLGNWDLV